VDLAFSIQEGPAADWRRAIDTGLPSPEDIVSEDEAPALDSRDYVVQERSVVVLVRRYGTHPAPPESTGDTAVSSVV
jgi:hypothetical protein